MASISRRRIFQSIYMIGFFFSLTMAIPAYINSEFLSQFVGTKSVGIIFTVSAAIALLMFSLVGKWLKKYGDYKIASVLCSIIIISLVGLIFAKNPFLLTVLFIAFDVSVTMLYFSIDIFLETYSKDNSTGTVRGTFLSIASSAWIIAPILSGLILISGKYWYIYLAALITFLPVLSLITSTMSQFKDSRYRNISIIKIVRDLPKHHSTYKIIASNFLLQFFYAWMVIYTPIYLHTYIGFDWQAIGVIFTIMLFPFAILEAPLGRLADERFGEKEMLTAGFIIIAISTALLSLITTADFWLWAAALLATRIGASAVEIMNETYFFKKNGENHPDIVSLFRMTKPTAYIIAPLIATFLLQFMGYQYLFVVLGAIMLLGLRYSLTLKDTL
ncbi:MAG TPA: MFS transporter [Candidatus Paceibacterota bacterium]